MNIRDLFYHTHGLDLFEETNLKLNLLLRDAFSGIPFHSWYQWRPNVVHRVDVYEEIWIIIIELTTIPKIIENWLQKEHDIIHNDKYPYVELKVVFFNFIDLPMIQSWRYIKFISKMSEDISKKQKFNKNYQQFCLTNSNKLSKENKIHISSAKKLHEAKWFFKEGVYIGLSTIDGAGFGLFSLDYIPPGSYICLFDGKKLTPDEFQEISLVKRIHLEAYVFEASFLIAQQGEEKDKTINLIFDPTNDNQELTIKDMLQDPNPGPWINEPNLGSVSNVFMQSFTYFDLLPENKNRYVLKLISARAIYPHEELFLHYEGNYFRKNYTPGEKCPDLLD